MIWNEFQQPQVRDLAWSLFSAPLMGALPARADIRIDQRAPTEPARAWLSALDTDPAALLQHLERRPSRRLGIYFENLLSFFYRSPLCRQDDGLELRAQNLQISQGGKTLGEFDFLLQNPVSARTVHAEAAVKFYLGIPDSGRGDRASQWHQWLGPGCRDRLDIKLTHLADRQLQLARQPAAHAPLNALGIAPDRIAPLAFLRGVLLYPAHTTMSPPAGAHPTHLRGRWYYLGDFPAREATGQWELLPRLQWLAPTDQGRARLHTTSRVRQLALAHFADHRQPLMLREHNTAQPAAALHMIVPDYWPRTT